MIRNGIFSLHSQRLIRSLLLFMLVGVPPFSFAQSAHFRQFSVDNGLPFVQVYTIFQDSKGYLWSGGYGGLSRFDGVSFTNFSPSNGLPNHWVTSITEDADQNLWVGTIEGASIYKDGVFKNYTTTDGLIDNFINCMIRDGQNRLWFGTAKGLSYYDGQKFHSFGKEGPSNVSVLCFYVEKVTNRLWIGTSNGVYLYEKNAFTHYPLSVLVDNRVTGITQEKNGGLIVGTSDGLFQLENNRFTVLFTPAGFEMPQVTSLITDRNGVVWVGADNGLFSYDGAKFRSHKVSLNANARKIISLYFDYENSLWLGTHFGLFRYRGEGFLSYGIHDGLYGNYIFGVTADKNGDHWICTQDNGVYRYANKTFESFGTDQGLASNKTSSCVTLPDGRVGVGTDRGLSIIGAGNQITNYTRANGLGSDSVNCLLVDKQGRLWFGGGKTITVYDKGIFKSYSIPTAPDVLFDVWCLHMDKDGLLWIGTYVGPVFTFDGTKFEDIRQVSGINTEACFGIQEDKNGRLYFGTLDGLFIYDRKLNGSTTKHIDEVSGLNSALIYCMVMDQESHYLWIGTNQGVCRFDIKRFAESEEIDINVYGKEEGFSGVETNSNGAYLDPDGSMWFGTVNGLIRYNPKEFRENLAYTKTNITGMRLFYADTILSNGIELNYDDNNISFEYVGICLSNPSKVRYKFMLAGFDGDWSPMTSERVARYSNLPSGKYTFRVVSRNNEGLWNNEPAEFSFTIATPYWKRTWFWLLLTSICIGMIILAVYFRIRQIKRREQLESETKVSMARNELKALRAQMNPHFVFNSLNSIQHFILTNKSADAGKYLNKFARLMRVILNNSDKSQITLQEELDYLQLYIELEEMRFENKFNWKITIEDNVDADYFEIPAMLLQPYIENAILHGLTPKKEKGLLELKIRLQGNTLVCSVIDNGIGRDAARDMRQLSTRKDHKSLGMKITHDRLELINRLNNSNLSLTITDLKHADQSPAGTQVDIFIPVS
jgi:ligand-binding sensor domain-containing protein/uncharacterized membrane-anchored protein YhcB (DUF1043 family)